jgi:HEAT repeat protein
MPADTQDKYNKQISDLVSTGEEGVLLLTDMLSPIGKGDNSRVDYALSGLSHFVSAAGKETDRAIIAGAYLKALDKTKDKSIKAFIIRQLQVAGKDESVNKLCSYLNDEELCSPASFALVQINTTQAQNALVKTLASATDNKIKAALAQAIGKAKAAGAESTLLTLLNSGDENLQKSVLYALGRTGSPASLKPLEALARSSGYTLDRTGSSEAYVSLIKNVLSAGGTKEAATAAEKLQKDSEAVNSFQTSEAALGILFAARPADVAKDLQKALKSDSREYRNAALNMASDYADGNMYSAVLKEAPKAGNDLKTDIINWIGREYNCPDKRSVLEGVNVDKKSVKEMIASMLNSNNSDVRQASLNTLVKIGDGSTISLLASILSNSDKDVVALVKNALMQFKGDISSSVISVIPKAGDEGKIAVLELLSGRKSEAGLTAVLDQIKTGSPAVKAAAYQALKDVVSAQALPNLYTMLETCAPESVNDMQKAVVAALSSLPQSEQVASVKDRMQQSGKDYLYYKVLAFTKDKDALQLIAGDFNTKSGEKKDAAFEALLGWKGEEAGKYLYAICKDPQNAGYFDRAMNAYIQGISGSNLKGDSKVMSFRKAIEIAKNDNQKKAALVGIGKTGAYSGMMYAGGFLDEKPVQQEAANAVMDIALNHKEYTGINVRSLLNKVIEVLDNPDADYQRQSIRKHLSEMPEEKPVEPFRLSSEEEKEGFKILFDGTNMYQWTGNTVDYILEDGCISMHPTETWGGNLYTKDEYADFVYRFEFQLTPAANNGVGIRAPMEGDNAYNAMEIQILDHNNPVYKNITPLQVHGSVYGIIGAKRIDFKPIGEWNTEEIYAKGNHIKVTVNGDVILDGDIQKATKNGTADGHEHPGLFNKKGHIGFLGHGSLIKFRNIRIKEL